LEIDIDLSAHGRETKPGAGTGDHDRQECAHPQAVMICDQENTEEHGDDRESNCTPKSKRAKPKPPFKRRDHLQASSALIVPLLLATKPHTSANWS
jgi:hypothetical protein